MPWPPKIFWVGLVIIYGAAVLGWLMEATIKMHKIPVAPIIYTSIICTLIIPVIVSVLFFYFPEKAEERRAKEKREEVVPEKKGVS